MSDIWNDHSRISLRGQYPGGETNDRGHRLHNISMQPNQVSAGAIAGARPLPVAAAPTSITKVRLKTTSCELPHIIAALGATNVAPTFQTSQIIAATLFFRHTRTPTNSSSASAIPRLVRPLPGERKALAYSVQRIFGEEVHHGAQ